MGDPGGHRGDGVRRAGGGDDPRGGPAPRPPRRLAPPAHQRHSTWPITCRPTPAGPRRTPGTSARPAGAPGSPSTRRNITSPTWPSCARPRPAATPRSVDLEAESTYGPHVKLGEFRCDDSERPRRPISRLGRASVRAWGRSLHPGRPDPAGADPRRGRPPPLLERRGPGPRPPDYLGSDGWIGPEAVRHYLAEHSPWAWSFWLWIPDRWLPAAWAGCLVVTALFALGLGSRVTAVLAWAIAVSTVRRAPVALFGFDHMIATWALYLAAFGRERAGGLARPVPVPLPSPASARGPPPGGGRRERGRSAAGRSPVSVNARLSLRLIQLHLALIYGSAGLSKLMGGVVGRDGHVDDHPDAGVPPVQPRLAGRVPLRLLSLATHGGSCWRSPTRS